MNTIVACHFATNVGHDTKIPLFGRSGCVICAASGGGDEQCSARLSESQWRARDRARREYQNHRALLFRMHGTVSRQAGRARSDAAVANYVARAQALQLALRALSAWRSSVVWEPEGEFNDGTAPLTMAEWTRRPFLVE